MAIPVVEFSRERYKIIKVFWLKINCSHMKLLNFENWSSGKLSNIGHHYSKKRDLEIDVKFASKIVFFNEKKSERFG